MKVLVVCLLAAALVGMGASTPLENVEGEKNVAGETALDVVEGSSSYPTTKATTIGTTTKKSQVIEGEEAFSSLDLEFLEEAFSSMEVEVLKEGPGKEHNHLNGSKSF